MKDDKLFDIIFNMKFATKQLTKSCAAAEKASQKEKANVKMALEKGNVQAARIYSENAIRKKNEALNYLRLASRIDAASSRIQTAMQMQQVTKAMKGTVKGMETALASMDPIKISRVMDAFEQQVGTMDVNLGTMDAAFESTNASTMPVGEVDSLMEQLAAEKNIDISTAMAQGNLGNKLGAPARHGAIDEDDITERLKALQSL